MTKKSTGRNVLQVIEPNKLAEAKGQKITKAYLDMLHITLHLIATRKDNPDNLDYKFSVNDYGDKFGLQFDRNSFRRLRQQVYQAMKNDTLLTMKNEKGNIVDFFPFQAVEYDEKNLAVTITLSKKFKDVLNELIKEKGEKIYFSLPDTLQMKSEYSKKMYPILLECTGYPIPFKGDGSLADKSFNRIDTLENFTAIACIPKSYVITRIRQVCDTICSEIDLYTPYHAEVFFNKVAGSGRYGKITHVCWTMKKKTTIKNSRKRPMTEKEKAEYTEITKNSKQMNLSDYGIDSDFYDVEDIVKITGMDIEECKIIYRQALKNDRTLDFVKEAYEEVKKSNNTKNAGKLMCYFMINGFIKNQDQKKKQETKKNSFNDFKQNSYDYDALVEQLKVN